MDVGCMPNSQRGNKCFLLVVDHSSKFCSAIALPHQQGPLIKSALWKTWLGVYGMPKNYSLTKPRTWTEQSLTSCAQS